MPKVNQKYVAEKEKSIVDAAIRVCRSKPAYAVTLRDVVKESGISQGGLYHYFKDIDEIFAEIFNRHFGENTVDDSEYKIFEGDKPLHEVITASFAVLGRLMDDMISRYGSLMYELNSIYMNEPERGKKIADRVQNHSAAKMLFEKIFHLIETRTASGEYELTVPKKHLMFLVEATMLGIQQIATFSQKFPGIGDEHGFNNACVTAKDMMAILAQSINGLLRKNTNNMYEVDKDE